MVPEFKISFHNLIVQNKMIYMSLFRISNNEKKNVFQTNKREVESLNIPKIHQGVTLQILLPSYRYPPFFPRQAPEQFFYLGNP